MRRTALAVLAVVLAAAALAFGVRRGPDPALWPPRGAERVVVYVVDNGYHSNLVVPRARLDARGGPSAAALRSVPPGPWIAVGWGDERFFTETGVNLRRAADGLRALFAPGNPAATMFEPLRAPPDRLYRSGVLRLEVSPEGFERMARRIDRSLLLDADGAPVPGPRGPSPDARFFRSAETFNILKLCNHWTAEVLHEGGLPTRPLLDSWGAGLAFDLKTWAVTLDSPVAGG